MMIDRDLKDLKWQDRCQDDCYVPYDHSHHFMLGKDIKKTCSRCDREMKVDAQIFGNELGRNRACLYNAYECNCGHTDTHILYDDHPKAYRDIYNAALTMLNSG